MLPTKATPAQRAGYTANIVAAWHAATPDQRERGAQWYRAAHELALLMSDGDAVRGAGVIAALSPNQRWERNQQLAADALAGNIHGTFGNSLRKAAAIMAGTDPVTLLPMSLKTGHFYRCIADPSDPDAVVIDRHAHDIAAREIYGQRDRGLSNANRYAMIAHCYREAAQQLGELPSTVQAATWIALTERNK